MDSRRRDGTPVDVYDGQGAAISRLYGTRGGRLLLRVLIRPWVSRLAGWFLDRRISRHLVKPFVEKNRLDLRDYPARPYRSFNDFFTRTVLPERRPVDPDRDCLIAPCDGKLTVIPIGPDTVFPIKGVSYTLPSLLGDAALAERYRGGLLLLFRLTVDDCHRYCYPADGLPGAPVRIPGVFHTVNPRAAAAEPIYRENAREYVRLETERFGTVLMMEVGALLVGRIRNHRTTGPVRRGQEKGMFEFGGSTVILLLEPDRLTVDGDLMQNAASGAETVIRMGERIGTSKPSGTGL